MAAPFLLMERDAGEPLEGTSLDALTNLFAKDNRLPDLSTLNATVLRYNPSFYEDVDLIEISTENWSPQHARVYYLLHDGDFYRLNGTSPPIHQVNAKADIVITESTVLDYLAFFCFFVRGDEGPFLIVDHLSNVYLPKIANTAELRSVFRQPAVWGQDENGDWRASALVYYSDALFFADFLIHLTGMIEMKDDQYLIADIGERVDAPLDVDGNLN